MQSALGSSVLSKCIRQTTYTFELYNILSYLRIGATATIDVLGAQPHNPCNSGLHAKYIFSPLKSLMDKESSSQDVLQIFVFFLYITHMLVGQLHSHSIFNRMISSSPSFLAFLASHRFCRTRSVPSKLDMTTTSRLVPTCMLSFLPVKLVQLLSRVTNQFNSPFLPTLAQL